MCNMFAMKCKTEVEMQVEPLENKLAREEKINYRLPGDLSNLSHK